MSSSKPTTLLARHRLLAPNAGIFVSPICLGTMNFGGVYTSTLGECSKETAFEILDLFYSSGGNFLDTASSYQGGESEKWIGEWLTKSGHRDEMVIATKYTSAFKQKSHPHLQQSNFGGNSAKSLRLSLESSLEKLQTSYVDILYVHYWDMTASIPEIMQSLNHLVATGKVIYLGISDTPAWIVAKCNAYAREHGLRPFSIYQGRWSAADRDFERDIIPMCRDEGMALAPWGVLGRGLFRSGNAPKEGGRNAPSLNNGREGPVSKVLSSVAATKGVPITNIALAYVQHKAPYVFPICGGRTVAHLRGNIEALGVTLSNEDITEIESGYDFDLGFPHNFLSATGSAPEGPEDISISNRRGTFEYVKSGYQITGAS